ncbi:MAG: hypothetical protein V4474_01790 [Patescibacteria group bacterium]
MAKRKPPCAEFIVAAIRSLRRSFKNMNEGVSAGLGLDKLFKVSSEAYSEKEFRDALNGLIKDKTIIVAVRVDEVEKDEQRSPPVPKLLSEIPREAPLLEKYWWKRPKGKFFEWDEHNRGKIKTYTRFDTLLVYVRADGLPLHIRRLDSGEGKHTTARQIIDAMQKSP